MLAGQLAQRRPDGEQLLLAALTGLLDGGARLGGLLEGGLETGQHDPGADQDRLGGPALARDPLAALDLAGPGLALGLGGAQELVGPAVQRAGALLGGAQGEPRLGLGGAGLAGQLDELLAGVELGLGGGVGLGPGQPALELGEPGLVLLAGGLGLLDRPGQPVRLGPRALRTSDPNWPSSSATAASVASDSCSLARATSTRCCASCRSLSSRDMSKASRSDGGDRLGELGARLVDGGLDLQQARLARRAAGRHVGAEQVAVQRHRGELGVLRDQPARRGEVADHGDPVEQVGQRGAHRVGALDRVDGVRRLGGQCRPGAARRGGVGAAADDQAGPAQVAGLEVVDGVDRGGGPVDDDRVGRGTEGAGDRGLVAAADGEQRGDRAEQPGHVPGGGEQRTGAVLAGQAELEGVLAGGERGPVAVGALGLLAGLGQPVLEVGERRGGGLVLRVETLLAGVEPGDPGLQGGEVVLRAGGPGERLLAGLLEAADLVGGRGGARAGGVDLAVQPGQPLAPVGGGALEPGDPALLLGRGVLGLVPGCDRLVERGAAAADLVDDPLLLRPQLGGLDLELLGVAARRSTSSRRSPGRCAPARWPATGCPAPAP